MDDSHIHSGSGDDSFTPITKAPSEERLLSLGSDPYHEWLLARKVSWGLAIGRDLTRPLANKTRHVPVSTASRSSSVQNVIDVLAESVVFQSQSMNFSADDS